MLVLVYFPLLRRNKKKENFLEDSYYNYPLFFIGKNIMDKNIDAAVDQITNELINTPVVDANEKY